MEITIQTRQGPKQVAVVARLGMLAVHETSRTVWWPEWRVYTVTHVPTGMSLCSGLRRCRAERMMRRLAGLEWNFEDPKGAPAETSAIARTVTVREFEEARAPRRKRTGMTRAARKARLRVARRQRRVWASNGLYAGSRKGMQRG